MTVVFVLLGTLSGAVIAFVLNKLLAGKIENKNQRIGLKAASYSICVLLGIIFAVFGMLRSILDDFMEDRIAFIEVQLVETFPNSNILETSIDTNEFTAAVDELQLAINAINTSGDSFFEHLVFDGFVTKLTSYVNAVETGLTSINTMSNENGIVTIKSILYGLKGIALNIVSPYFVFGQIGVLILLFIYIGVYTGIVIYFKRGGTMYNKSIVFGNITDNKNDEEIFP